MSYNSVKGFICAYEDLISKDKIVSIIKDKGFKKEKENIQSLVSYTNSLLGSGNCYYYSGNII